MKFIEFFKKIFRRINKLIAGSRLYLKFYTDNTVWENTAFFESYTGQSFQGNPYYIFKEMLKREDCANMKFYIAVINADEWKIKLKQRGLLKKNVRVVTYGSVAYVKALCHCKYLINNVIFNAKFIKKSEQIYLNTWHGTGPKCVGNKLSATPKAFVGPQRDLIIADYLVCPNKHSERIFLEDHMLSNICEQKFINVGYPRNTQFFDKLQREKIIQENHLQGKKVVVYLPTWRGTERLKDDLKAINEINKIAAKLSDTHIFYCKLHPNMLRMNFLVDNCRAIPDKYELYEFLCCADYLISDWSSVYTDFANKSSNIILFQYDRDYMLDDRGLYLDFVNNSPFPVAKTGEDVLKLIDNDFAVDSYENFLKLYCAYDNIDCTKDVIDIILKNKKQSHSDITLIYIDKCLSKNEIDKLKAAAGNSIYKFVINDSLSDDDYLYFNNIDGFEYLIFSHTHAKNMGLEINKKRLWGNLGIEKLLYVNDDTIPEFLLKCVKVTIKINL